MTLVRCSTHGIPYNDENPRGCPACLQDQQGRKSQAVMMRELAQASQPIDDNLEAALRGPTLLERVNDFLEDLPDASKILSRGGPFIIGALLLFIFLTSGPTYVEQPDPVPFTGTPRVLDILPRAPISRVFQALGEQTPERVGPVERYRYGAHLIIEAINGYVYSIDMTLTNRSWRGLRVGLSRTEAEGYLANLGTPRESAQLPVAPEIRDGRQVYPTAAGRPYTVVSAEVRGTAGCYDVLVQLRPQQMGLLTDGDQRYSVVGDADEPLRYVVTNIRVVDRTRNGPELDAVC